MKSVDKLSRYTAIAVMILGASGIWLAFAVSAWSLLALGSLITLQWAWVALETGTWIRSWDQVQYTVTPKPELEPRYVTIAYLFLFGLVGCIVIYWALGNPDWIPVR